MDLEQHSGHHMICNILKVSVVRSNAADLDSKITMRGNEPVQSFVNILNFPSDSRGVGEAVPAGASRSADRRNEASGGTTAAGPDSAGENHHRVHGEDGQSNEAVASQGQLQKCAGRERTDETGAGPLSTIFSGVSDPDLHGSVHLAGMA